MPRKRRVIVREILPDQKYSSILIAKFVSCLMKKGKKGVAEKILYDSLDIIQQKTKKDAIEVLNKAVENVQPLIEVKSRRVGGATYQVPVEVRSERRIALGLRWLINAARERGEKTMQGRIAAELLDALENKGSAIKKREDTHKMAEANKAFAHYRW